MTKIPMSEHFSEVGITANEMEGQWTRRMPSSGRGLV